MKLLLLDVILNILLLLASVACMIIGLVFIHRHQWDAATCYYVQAFLYDYMGTRSRK